MFSHRDTVTRCFPEGENRNRVFRTDERTAPTPLHQLPAAPGGAMLSNGPGRKRIPNRDRLTAEDDALNQIVREVRLPIDPVIDTVIGSV